MNKFKVGEIVGWTYQPCKLEDRKKRFKILEINANGTLKVESLSEEDRIYQVQAVLDGRELWINSADPEWFRKVEQ